MSPRLSGEAGVGAATGIHSVRVERLQLLFGGCGQEARCVTEMTLEWNGHTGKVTEYNFKIFYFKASPELVLTSFHFCRTPGSPPGESRDQLEYECALIHLLFPEPETSSGETGELSLPGRMLLRKGESLFLPLAPHPGPKPVLLWHEIHC